MITVDLLIAELRRDEGVRRIPYKDTKGIMTVGVGHNLKASPLLAGWAYPLTDAQIDELLNADLQRVFSGLDDQMPWWRTLDEVRQRVIANMAFNLGIGRLGEFHNTLNAMQKGNYHAAAVGMASSLWARQVGKRAVRLSAAMKTGIMPD